MAQKYRRLVIHVISVGQILPALSHFEDIQGGDSYIASHPAYVSSPQRHELTFPELKFEFTISSSRRFES